MNFSKRFDFKLDENGIKFNVVASRSIEEPPSIEVAFDNGIKDNFDLAHYQLDSKTPIGCRYIGRLQNDPSSTVAVSGCLNKPGDQMEVTMISKHNNHMMYTVDFDGNAEIQENPLGEKGLKRKDHNLFCKCRTHFTISDVYCFLILPF